jgi:hypothetical protein
MKSILFLVLTIFSISLYGQIDLEKKILNDKFIDTLNVDDITSIFGRPSFVKDNIIVKELLGPELYYHKLGLKFSFKPNNVIWYFTIHLSRTWDKNSSEWFSQYDNLLQKIDANNNLNDIKSMFLNGELIEPTDKMNYYFYKYNKFIFKFEGVTKYLESITYYANDL